MFEKLSPIPQNVKDLDVWQSEIFKTFTKLYKRLPLNAVGYVSLPQTST